MKPLAIIGLDPGITSAYVVMGLDGQILKSNSEKELTLARMIFEISEVCLPVIVSTDKAKIPGFIEEFARKVGAEIIAPEEDLPREEKAQLLKQNKPNYQLHNYFDNHQKDSLAAAVFAYQKIQGKIHKINSFIEEKKIDSLREDFTRIALKEDLNFNLIKDVLTKPTEENKVLKEIVKAKEMITKKDFLKVFQKLKLEENEKINLQSKIRELVDKLNAANKMNYLLSKKTFNFNHKIESLLSFKEERLKLQNKELKKQEEIIEEMQHKVRDLWQFIALIKSHLLLKKLPSLGQNDFRERNKFLHIKERDYVVIEKPQVFSEKVLEELQNKGITFLSPENFPIVIKNNFYTEKIKYADLIIENEFFALIKPEVLEEQNDQKDYMEKIITSYQEKRLKGETEDYRPGT